VGVTFMQWAMPMAIDDPPQINSITVP